jgi:hypothetical protein
MKMYNVMGIKKNRFLQTFIYFKNWLKICRRIIYVKIRYIFFRNSLFVGDFTMDRSYLRENFILGGAQRSKG